MKADKQTAEQGNAGRPFNKANKSNRVAVWMLGALASVAVVMTAVLLVPKPAEAADITVYKSPTCGCCGKWVDHLKANGFDVEVKQRRDMRPIKRELGIKPALQSCHTGIINGYVIEGHVPAADIKRLLEERPQVRGLAVPGMPAGSPGMESPRPVPYEVVSFDASGNTETFSRH